MTPRSAMTLIELLLSIVLASMLLLATIGVLRGMRMTEQASRTDLPDNNLSATRNILWRDYASSVGMHQDDSGAVWMQCDGPTYVAGVDDAGSEPSWSGDLRPIGYQVNDDECLIRIDSGTDPPEVLATQVEQWTVRRLDNTGLPQPLPPRRGPNPPRLQITLKRRNSPAVVWVFKP